MLDPFNLPINLLQYKAAIKTKRQEGTTYIFDEVRRKWLVLQPEEFVRQLMVYYLINEKEYNKNRFSLERGIAVNTEKKRFDALVYDLNMKPFLLIECKAPQVKITEDTFEQIQAYNYSVGAQFLLVSNGIQNFAFRVDRKKEGGQFILDIPLYPE